MSAVEVRREHDVVTVVLNRPERRNALDAAMIAELAGKVGRLSAELGLRAVVLTGAGGAFCSGGDQTEDLGALHPHERMRQVTAAAAALHGLPVPTIARVDGAAVGAGLSIVLGCDLAVASTRSRFAMGFTQRALSPDFGGSWFLPRAVGGRRAMELALLGEMVDAEEALRLGIVNRLAEPAELDSVVEGWVQRIRAGAPIAVELTRRLVRDATHTTLEQALAAEACAQTVNLTTGDLQEARAAFRESRAPRFRGARRSPGAQAGGPPAGEIATRTPERMTCQDG